MWLLIDIAPPIALIMGGLLCLHEGMNALGAALVWCGILQIGALNRVAVLEWLAS